MPIIKRIVAAAAELNIKPSAPTSRSIFPGRATDIHSLLGQARDGLKQAKGYASVSTIAKEAVAAFSTMIPALERADKALNSASVADCKSGSLPAPMATSPACKKIWRCSKARRPTAA